MGREHRPLIGRPVEQDLRELVISQGKSAYLALYGYEAAQDTILMLSQSGISAKLGMRRCSASAR